MEPLGSQKIPEIKKVRHSDGTETVHHYVFGETLSKECKLFAERELGETPEKLSRGIKYLKMYLKEKGLPQTEECYLLAVLRNCKYDLKKSKTKLEKFIKAKEVIAGKLAEMDLDTVNRILDDTNIAILPYRDKHRRLVYMSRASINLEAYTIHEIFACSLSQSLLMMSDPMTTLYGIAYIGDSKTPSVALMYQIVLAFKTWIKTIVDLPLPMKRIDLTNENVLIRWYLNIARHIIPAKIYKRISFHGSNYESLKKAYHPDLLPEDLEGNLGPLSNAHYREKLFDFIKKLRDEHRAKISTE